MSQEEADNREVCAEEYVPAGPADQCIPAVEIAGSRDGGERCGRPEDPLRVFQPVPRRTGVGVQPGND